MTRFEDQDKARLEELEMYFRACACRSTTPFFREVHHKVELSSHKRNGSKQICRTPFQHDRDKVLYSKSFRRLRLKSQMFPEQTADHLRTRLDHSLEVAQIARHFARQLKLNEDLVDAISLAHDIGHAPFAHSGERALHKFLIEKKVDGFKHNWQGLRVVDKLDKSYPEHEGLDLTRAVRIGILKHTRLRYKGQERTACTCDMQDSIEKEFAPKGLGPKVDIFEVQLVAFADEIAQIIHDFEDAIISRTIDIESVVKNHSQWPLISQCLEQIKSRCSVFTQPELEEWKDFSKFDFSDEKRKSLLLSRIRSEVIYQLTNDALSKAKPELDKWEEKHLREGTPDDFNRYIEENKDLPGIIKLEELDTPYKELEDKLEKIVGKSERVSRMDGKADYIIRHILDIYLNKPMLAPQALLDLYAINIGTAGKEIRQYSDEELRRLKDDKDYIRAAVDYVAGMTDRYALREYDQLYTAYPRSEM